MSLCLLVAAEVNRRKDKSARQSRRRSSRESVEEKLSLDALKTERRDARVRYKQSSVGRKRESKNGKKCKKFEKWKNEVGEGEQVHGVRVGMYTGEGGARETERRGRGGDLVVRRRRTFLGLEVKTRLEAHRAMVSSEVRLGESVGALPLCGGRTGAKTCGRGARAEDF